MPKVFACRHSITLALLLALLLAVLLLPAGPLVARGATIPRVAKTLARGHYGWADVLHADPVYGRTKMERHRQECVGRPVVVHGGGRANGTVLGTVIGGVLGSTVGKGDGRTAATVVAAVAGGAVGHVAARGREYASTAMACHDVVTVSEQRRLLGYDVEYRYHGEIYASRLSYDPGARIRVRIDVYPAE